MSRRLLPYLVLALLLSACGPAKPLSHDIAQPGEIPPGPGLISGNEGKFILYGESESE